MKQLRLSEYHNSTSILSSKISWSIIHAAFLQIEIFSTLLFLLRNALTCVLSDWYHLERQYDRSVNPYSHITTPSTCFLQIYNISEKNTSPLIIRSPFKRSGYGAQNTHLQIPNKILFKHYVIKGIFRFSLSQKVVMPSETYYTKHKALNRITTRPFFNTQNYK